MRQVEIKLVRRGKKNCFPMFGIRVTVSHHRDPAANLSFTVALCRSRDFPAKCHVIRNRCSLVQKNLCLVKSKARRRHRGPCPSTSAGSVRSSQYGCARPRPDPNGERAVRKLLAFDSICSRSQRTGGRNVNTFYCLPTRRPQLSFMSSSWRY